MKTRDVLVTTIYGRDRLLEAVHWCADNARGKIKIVTQKFRSRNGGLYTKRVDRPFRKISFDTINQIIQNICGFVTLMFENPEDACLFSIRFGSFNNSRNPILNLPYKWVLHRSTGLPPGYYA